VSAGPFANAGQVAQAIGYPGRALPREGENELALLAACAHAGVELGAYDRKIIGWLARTGGAQRCAVVAGIILRASEH
jgi:hypothetical protein